MNVLIKGTSFRDIAMGNSASAATVISIAVTLSAIVGGIVVAGNIS